MTSDMMLEIANFQNPPLLNLLLKLSVAFQVLYIPPPRPKKIGPPGRMAQPSGESYQTELENYKEELRFLNSDEGSNWMEIYFKDALRFSDDEWGPTGYILNEMTSPNVSTKRKFTDMISSNIRYNQGGTFLPSDQADEDQDATMNEGEDSGGNDEENEEENNEPPSSRRRFV